MTSICRVLLWRLVKAVKGVGKGADLDGVGLCVALSVGEMPLHRLRELRESGASRYLLRIESSNPDLFRRIHPPEQSFEQRVQCLRDIKAAGLQLGTGENPPPLPGLHQVSSTLGRRRRPGHLDMFTLSSQERALTMLCLDTGLMITIDELSRIAAYLYLFIMCSIPKPLTHSLL
jgi:hypothetical protein